MDRVYFIAGALALAGFPLVAAADEPSPQPETRPAPPATQASALPTRSPKPKPTRAPHVHGPNGVVSLPEHRRIEWTMDVLDGPGFKLSAYRGMAVFMNVFATWCEPCQDEQSDIVAFAKAHADDTVVIGVDVGEEDNDVRAYRKKYQIGYPIAMDRRNVAVRTVSVKEHFVYPTTIVFRPDGTLSCAWQSSRSRAWFEFEREAALAPPAEG